MTSMLRRRPLWPPFVAWFLVALGLLPWAKRFGSAPWAAMAPLGAMQVQLAAIWGIFRRLAGRGVLWKGRRL